MIDARRRWFCDAVSCQSPGRRTNATSAWRGFVGKIFADMVPRRGGEGVGGGFMPPAAKSRIVAPLEHRDARSVSARRSWLPVASERIA